MAIESGIFNSVNGDRMYDASDYAAYFAMFIGNGIFPNPANGFQVVANSGMNITLKAGRAWIHGYYATNPGDYHMALDVADGVLNRIDRVVLQLNYLNREIVPLIRKGVPASNASAPALKRDADTYEIALAEIYVSKGSTSVIQANITDLRMKSDLCGIVHGTVDQVDTSEIFHQFQDWFERMKEKGNSELAAWTNEQKQLFIDWFNGLKDILSQNAETNILNKIHDIEVEIGELLQLKTINKSSVVGAINELADNYNKVATDYDNYGIARKAEWRRQNGTIFRKSALSNPDARGNYQSQQLIYYAENGTTAVKTQQWAYTYDNRDNETSETLISEVFH